VAEILRKVSKERHHPQLITLLASYEQNGLFNFIFPWAELDLFGYWEKHARPVQNSRTARWIANQCRGLVEAMSRIHGWHMSTDNSVGHDEKKECDHDTKDTKKLPEYDEKGTESIPRTYVGIHGALKPESILWYPGTSSADLGILKITDFGDAGLSRDYAKLGVMTISPTYRSPEFEVVGNPSPACDVWALGCIFLEIVTWFWGGQKKLQEFGISRLERDEKFHEIMSDKFFTIYYTSEEPSLKEARVKYSVAKVSI
jgi:serine/threonine protein kinase